MHLNHLRKNSLGADMHFHERLLFFALFAFGDKLLRIVNIDDHD